MGDPSTAPAWPRELHGCQLGTKGMGYKGLPCQGSSTVPTGLSRNLPRSSIKVASVCGMHLSLCQAPQAAHGWHRGLVPLTVQSPAWHMASGSPDWRRTRLHLSGHRPSPNGGGSSDTPWHLPGVLISCLKGRTGSSKSRSGRPPPAVGGAGRRLSTSLRHHFSDVPPDRVAKSGPRALSKQGSPCWGGSLEGPGALVGTDLTCDLS